MIPEIFTCPNPYTNYAGYQKAITQLQQDTLWAYDQAFLGPEKWVEDPRQVIMRWVLGCKGVQGEEGHLVFTFKAQLFQEVILSFKMNDAATLDWVRDVVRPTAAHIYDKVNNWGAWGLLGCTLADLILGNNTQPHEDRWYQFISRATDSDGVMIEEIRRVNWYWYSYFALAPLLRVSQLLNTLNKYMLLPALKWYWKQCQDPKQKPYKPGLFGWHYLFNSKVELPDRTNNWPVNLWWVAGKEFRKSEWQSFGGPPPYRDVIFRHG